MFYICKYIKYDDWEGWKIVYETLVADRLGLHILDNGLLNLFINSV